MEFLSTTFWGNTVQQWATALGVVLGAYFALRMLAFRVLRRLLRAATTDEHYWDDVAMAALKATRASLLLAVSVWAGSLLVELPARVSELLESLTVIAGLIQVGLWTSAGLTQWLTMRSLERAADDPAEAMTVNIIGMIAKLALWSIVLLFALENLGVDVTALVAGLGIGGIAVALAAQNILGDLFASLSIILDKPFVLGDFIAVGDFVGGVEAIGLKTTRVRSLSGEQVVFSNTDLLNSRVRNYGRLYQRRVVLKIGVTYQTPRRELAEIPGILRSAIEGEGGDRVRFDRAHLDTYGDSAIVFEAVYIVLDSDFALHMDLKQAILLRIHEMFEERRIEYAYPTQTVFVERSDAAERGSATRA